MFFQHLPCDGFCFQLCRATVHKHAAYQDLSVFRVFQACFNRVFVSCKSNCVPVPCKILFTSVDRCSCSWYMIHSTHVHTCHEKTQKAIQEPSVGNAWGCSTTSNVNVSEHIQTFRKIHYDQSEALPGTPSSASSIYFNGFVAPAKRPHSGACLRTDQWALRSLPLTLAKILGPTKLEWKHLKTQDRANLLSIHWQKECSQLFSCLLTPNNWPPLLVIFPSLYR